MIKNIKGVTLIEAVMGMAILMVLAGGMLTILKLNATETSEGIANSRIQMQYENFIQELARDIRGASCVLDNGENFDSAVTYLAQKDSKDILIYAIDGTVLGGYRIAGDGTLEEFDPAANKYVPYRSGSRVVEVTDNSTFRLLGARKGVEARVHARYTYKTVSDSLSANTNYLRCRN